MGISRTWCHSGEYSDGPAILRWSFHIHPLILVCDIDVMIHRTSSVRFVHFCWTWTFGYFDPLWGI